MNTPLILVGIRSTGTSYPAGKSGRRGWTCVPGFSQAILSSGQKLYLGADGSHGAAVKAARAVGADTAKFEACSAHWVKTGRWEMPTE
jgi:hypothetical protein